MLGCWNDKFWPLDGTVVLKHIAKKIRIDLCELTISCVNDYKNNIT
jgi:hypothetical protein